MQGWGKEHGTECRFHLLYNPQAAGLRERTNGMLKQYLKLLTDKATVAGCTKVLSEAFTHLNDQRVGLLPHVPDWGPLRKHRYQKGMSGNSHCPDFYHGSTCYVLPNCITPGKGDYLLEFALGHSTRMGEGELLHLHWVPVVLPQAGPAEMHYTWNGMRTTGKEEKVRVLVSCILPPVHLLKPDSTTSPG